MLNFLSFSYILASIFFIFSIRGLASPKTARQGNIIGILGMAIAIISTLISPDIYEYYGIVIAIALGGIVGVYGAFKVRMTSLPQMVAAFNGLGGLSAILISIAEILNNSPQLIENSIGLIIGALAFSGSFIAFAKLQGIMKAKAITFPFQQAINALIGISIIALCIAFVLNNNQQLFHIMAFLSIILGILVVIPIGGADMPVVISILNSYSGWAAVGIGFSLNNSLLIIVGSIVGASGSILSYIMCKAMNRSLTNVIFGSISTNQKNKNLSEEEEKIAKAGDPTDAAFIMENANKVIIVPGYGMAAAQAQHILKTMAYDLHEKYGVEVKFAIHPVAGRMPGHMNVLLAEANVPYEDVFELEDINREFETADVAYVIGANDVTNPSAKTDSSSPLYGMPILDVEKAKTVFFVKRSLASGYSGVENPLFYAPNTIMLYGDAKNITSEIVAALERE